jgi:glycosyltransferase involved in cell wall biosynthesis
VFISILIFTYFRHHIFTLPKGYQYMHICYLTGEYPQAGYPHGGIGTFVKNIAQSLAQKNVRVTVISNGNTNKDEIIENGLLTVHYLRSSQWPVFKFIDYAIRFNNIIRKTHQQHPIDVLESQENGFATIKKIVGITYVIRLHGGHHYFAEAENRPTEWRKVRNEKASFAKADALVSVSNYTNTRTAHFIGYNPANTAVIPNGIDLTKFTPGTTADIVPHRLVFAGTVCEKKGIRQLVMALPEVKKKFPDTELIVLGNLTAPDRNTGGLYLDYLKGFIDPSVKDAIKFIGFVENEKMQDYFRSAEACVLPSHMETQGIVAVEAMAMEKLTIFGKDGPGPEVIEDKITGLLCDPQSEQDIAQKIIFAFDNPEISKKIARQARKTVEERYNNETLSATNISFYQSLITV